MRISLAIILLLVILEGSTKLRYLLCLHLNPIGDDGPEISQ